MNIANIILVGTAALIVSTSTAPAQQAPVGTVTKVDRINRTIAVRPIESGTTGANTAGAAEEFKAQDGLSLDAVHAGDRVTYTVTEANGIKTITKVQKQ
jgi:hypothetical protein